MCGSCIPEYPTRSETVEHPLLPRITDTRLDKFFWSPYASQHLDTLLERARYTGPEHVKLTYWSCPGDTKVGYEEAISHLEGSDAGLLEMGYKFGPSWTNHWVKAVITIPETFKNVDQPLIFEFDPSCEALIFSEDGTPQHGITGGTNTMKDGRPGEQEDRRVEHIIPAEAVKKGIYTIYIEVTANGMFGLGPYRYQTPDPNRQFPLVAADIIVPNLGVRALKVDFRILTETARHPSAKLMGLGQRALKACDDIMNRFRRYAGDTDNNYAKVDEMIQECREIAWKVLGRLDEEGLKEVCVWNTEEKNKEAKVWAIGHCHIDTAWLWRYTQTQQKIARSWTTQCDLMDRWPNHQFAASSAQQYLWLEQLYPKAFDRVKHYIEKGRFHYVGGAWLEHDCMMPSGESLVRQYLYGQRYFRNKFGAYCREAWLPDTFGYASQLPQILRLAGLNYFFTQKISWNNINVFPYSTFNWSGIDGTQVLAHMTPVDNYNGQCTYGEIIKGVSANKNLEVTDQCLFLFGNGDGGGGPTPLMMEKLERLGSLGQTTPEVPAIKMGSPIDFFDDLCRRTDGGKKLPTWKGELYLELHRGTYTSQTGIKKGNRDMETALRDLEYFATLAALKDASYKYPKGEIDEMWQDTMLAQFHDCLPGTTIKTVVLDNLEIYSKRGAQARSLIDQALQVLAPQSNAVTVIDPLRLCRNEVYDDAGKLKWLKTDSTGIGQFQHSEGLVAPEIRGGDQKWTISNARFSLTIADGRISSIYDQVANRELIVPGPGCDNGGLMIYEDLPLNYDAWDAEIYHLKCGSVINFDTVYPKEGVDVSLRSTLVAEATFGDSKASIEISLDALQEGADQSQPTIRVKAKIDWHEKHKFLKFALPLDIHCAYATYGTQFGVLERPTHRNTTIDQAKFEVCAHGFADLSEATYGLAIASRDKYGYAVEGNVMRLSLVRAPTSPDPETDQGHHDIDFAIIPHLGQLASSQVQAEALKFNNAPYVVSGSPSDLPSFSITGPDAKAIQLETIKRGEDDQGDGIKTIILRLHESYGGRAQGRLIMSGIKVKSAEWVNILEEPMPGKEAKCDFGTKDEAVEVGLNMRHFEIKTLKLVLA